MKNKLLILAAVVILILLVILYTRFGGVTHERIYDAVADRSNEILDRIDARATALDTKLDRLEGKLDQLLEIANRPMPDAMRKAD